MLQPAPTPLVKKPQHTAAASSLSEAYLPQSVLDDNAAFAATLQRIRELELGIDSLVTKKVRKGLLEAMHPQKDLKILRVYASHIFVPSNDAAEKPYFLLTLEGRVLDDNVCIGAPFASFFEKIRFQADKRVGPSGTISIIV